MADASDLLWPVLGPLSSVRTIVRHTRSLKNHNPLPYPMIVNNCLAWMLYGLLCRNYFIFSGNLIGWTLGLYYVLAIFGVAFASGASSVNTSMGKTGLPTECLSLLALLIGGSSVVLLGAMMAFINAYPQPSSILPPYVMPTERQVSIMGNTAILLLVLFYSSPLSALATVLRTKNSAPFQWGLCTTCLINGLLWTMYGWRIDDIYVWLPNMIGCLMSAIQLLCKVVFPELPTTPSLSPNGGGGVYGRLPETIV